MHPLILASALAASFSACAETWYYNEAAAKAMKVNAPFDMPSVWTNSSGETAFELKQTDRRVIPSGSTCSLSANMRCREVQLHVGTAGSPEAASVLHSSGLMSGYHVHWHNGMFRSAGWNSAWIHDIAVFVHGTESGGKHLWCYNKKQHTPTYNMAWGVSGPFTGDARQTVTLKLLEKGCKVDPAGNIQQFPFSGNSVNWFGKFEVSDCANFVLGHDNAAGSPLAPRADAITLGPYARFAVQTGVTPNSARGIKITGEGVRFMARMFPKGLCDCTDYTLNMPISGAYGFSKTGSGRVAIGGAYSAGAIVVEEGVLEILGSAKFAAGTEIAVKSGATLLSRQPISRLKVKREEGATVRQVSAAEVARVSASPRRDTPVPASVRVTDYGYDAADSTRFLQAAIDSGAKRVVIDAKRWISLPLKCRSEQEIFFEDGAVVEAKKGAFINGGDKMFTADFCTNLTIGGKGEVRMHHADYLKPPYRKSEFRHSICIRDSANVRVWGLRIVNGGGDGVYVGGKMPPRVDVNDGGCHDITLEDLYIDTNVRQGLSVTFCDGLTAERCSFLNTRGVPPSAGVDIEPDGSYNRIRRIVFRDCVFGGNAGQGVSLSVGGVWKETTPTYDVTFERCRFDRDNVGGGGHGGRIVFKDCVFENPKVMPLGIAGGPFSRPDCEVSGCMLRENGKDIPMDGEWLRNNAVFLSDMPDIVSKTVLPEYRNVTVSDPEPGKMLRFFGRFGVRCRNGARIVAYADSPRLLKIKASKPPVNKKGKRIPMLLTITGPDGQLLAKGEFPDDGVISINAPAKGFYTIVVRTRKGVTLPFHAANCPIAFDISGREFPVVQTNGDFAFFVPPGTMRFEAMVGGAGRECCGASVLDPGGNVAWSNSCISAWCGHLQRGPAKPGMWKLSVGRADRGRFEDMGISLTGIPALLFPNTERHWK